MEQWFYLLRSPVHNLDVVTQEWVYRSFSRFVYRNVFSIVNDHELTEDIIQETFVKVAEQGPKLCSDVNIPGWVSQVARNTAIDFLRKWKNERELISYIGNILDKTQNETSVASEVETRVRNELLHEAICELKPDYQSVLVLFYLEEKSYRDICEELKLSEAVLSQRLARARKKLLQHFLRKWVQYDD